MAGSEGMRRSFRPSALGVREESVQLNAGLVGAGIGEPLELEQVAGGHGPAGQQMPGVNAALVEQFVEFVQIVAGIGQVGEPVESALVPLVREGAEDIPVSRFGHGAMVRFPPLTQQPLNPRNCRVSAGAKASYPQ